MGDDVAPVKGTRWRAWLRVCLPLLLWLALFTVGGGIKLHEHLLKQTRLESSVSFMGSRNLYAHEITLDGSPYRFGELMSLGRHTLTIRNPKAVTFQTNLFIWYGKRELGEITLARAKGTIALSAMPEAQRFAVFGAEFTVVLTNSTGITSTVPTGEYVVETAYRYWRDRQTVTITADTIAARRVAPRFGAVVIEASHGDIAFELRDDSRRLVESGMLPVTLAGLPAGNDYRLHVERKDDGQESSVTIKEGATNTVKVEFVYGAVAFESTPPGATVFKDGRTLGVTPLHLAEVNLGAFAFSLRLDEYEPVAGSFAVVANQTNAFQANLISQRFTRAMAAAQQYYANANYERAAEAANEALQHKVGDEAATALKRDAKTMWHLVKAEMLALRGEFTNAMSEANLALKTTPDSKQAKELLADYTKREQEHLEAVRKREAELAELERQRRERERIELMAQQRIKELHDGFAAANRPYENAAQFASHELVLTNDVRTIGNAINLALTSEQPAFGNAKMSWIYPHIFMIEARQMVGIGYRATLILGTQVRENEVRIQFKVFEYEHPPDLKLLGGLFQLSAGITVTSQDANIAANNAERFQQRITEGITLLKKRIAASIIDVAPPNRDSFKE